MSKDHSRQSLSPRFRRRHSKYVIVPLLGYAAMFSVGMVYDPTLIPVMSTFAVGTLMFVVIGVASSRLWPRYIDRDVLSTDELRRIRDRASYLWRQNLLNFVLYMASVLSVPVVIVVAGYVLKAVGVQLPWRGMIAVAGALMLSATCLNVLHRIGYAPLFRRAARERGHPVCQACGYWLKGAHRERGRCPECGHAVEEQRA